MERPDIDQSSLKVSSETKSFLSNIRTHVGRVAHINQLEGAALEQALAEIHQICPQGGRNIAAGYVRAWSLFFGRLAEVIRHDPLFHRAFHMVQGGTLLGEKRFMNLFLLLKYSISNMPGDIIEFGSFRCGTAIFIAYVAHALGMNKKIYALDTFEGIPETDEHIDLHPVGDFKEVSFDHIKEIVERLHLDNLVLVKGRFQDTFPKIATSWQSLALAHIDSVTYSSVKYATDAIFPHLYHRGGYLVVDDVLCSACMGTLQAVEEMVSKYDLNAEQTAPHFIYRHFN